VDYLYLLEQQIRVNFKIVNEAESFDRSRKAREIFMTKLKHNERAAIVAGFGRFSFFEMLRKSDKELGKMILKLLYNPVIAKELEIKIFSLAMERFTRAVQKR
jgi:hypothetical protein